MKCQEQACNLGVQICWGITWKLVLDAGFVGGLTWKLLLDTGLVGGSLETGARYWPVG